MMTVTLGTIPFPFVRAITWLEILLDQGIISEPIFIQHGVTDASKIASHPLVKAVPLTDSKTLFQMIKDSRLVISHAGQGSTRALVKQGKSFTLLPRLARYGEHIDDHQLLFAQSAKNMGISLCLTVEELELFILNPDPPLEKLFFSSPKLCDHLFTVYPSSYINTTVV